MNRVRGEYRVSRGISAIREIYRFARVPVVMSDGNS